MILFLLNCSISWCQKINENDTSITIPIETVKSINSKLIERQLLNSLVQQQDTLINELNTKINVLNAYNQNAINALESQKNINEKLNKNLKTTKTINYILIGTTTVSITALVIVCLTK